MKQVHARYTGNTKLMRETGDSLCQLKTLMMYRKYMGEGESVFGYLSMDMYGELRHALVMTVVG